MVLLLKCLFRWIAAFVLFAFIAACMSYFGALETIDEGTFTQFFEGEIQFWFYTFLLFVAGVALITFPLPLAKFALNRYLNGSRIHHLLVENMILLVLAILPLLIWYSYGFPINEIYLNQLMPLYLLCLLLCMGRFKRIPYTSKQD